MSKIYISGPITGLPYEVAYNNFANYEKTLKRMFPTAEIVNPMKLKCEGTTWSDFMVNDIKHLFECDTIVMFPGWQKSKGAKIERYIAMQTDKIILKLKL